MSVISAKKLVKQAKKSKTPQIVSTKRAADLAEFQNGNFLPGSGTEDFSDGETVEMKIISFHGGADAQGRKKAWAKCSYKGKIYTVSGRYLTKKEFKARQSGNQDVFGKHISETGLEAGDKATVGAVPYKMDSRKGTYLTFTE